MTEFQIKNEGEEIELKCRLEEEVEEGEMTVTWYFNDVEIKDSERVCLTFDGTYAKLYVQRYV